MPPLSNEMSLRMNPPQGKAGGDDESRNRWQCLRIAITTTWPAFPCEFTHHARFIALSNAAKMGNRFEVDTMPTSTTVYFATNRRQTATGFGDKIVHNDPALMTFAVAHVSGI